MTVLDDGQYEHETRRLWPGLGAMGRIGTMAINEWWTGQSAERFWMEITDRTDLGADLFAPTTDQKGRPYWGYELVTRVQRGDVVLHWHKTLVGRPAVVGWSTAEGPLEDSTIEWRARGTSGRATGSAAPRPAWRLPLTGYTPLAAPIDEAVLRGKETLLRQVKERLETRHGSSVLYYPFAFSDTRPVRTSQTYLVKMPWEVVEILGLSAASDRLSGHGSSRPDKETRAAGPTKGSGYIADARVRSAIELRAVDMCVRYYVDNGYTCEYVGDRQPFDLVVRRGPEERRVEVKGSSGRAETVELTAGEVKNAAEYVPVDLAVVDRITWQRLPDGSVQADDGALRVWPAWCPSAESLIPIRFRHVLPAIQ